MKKVIENIKSLASETTVSISGAVGEGFENLRQVGTYSSGTVSKGLDSIEDLLVEGRGKITEAVGSGWTGMIG